MPSVTDQIVDLLQQSGLKGKDLKATLRDAISRAWPSLPPWSTLATPVIEEVQKATVGSGVALVFKEDNVWHTVLGQAGAHYTQAGANPAFMIPGGFINLSHTPGSTLVSSSGAPEDARIGAAREIEEEFKNADGSPLLQIDPSRLKPMDTKTLSFPNGEKRLVLGFMLELTAKEIQIVKAHKKNLDNDQVYRQAVALQALGDSGRPEVDGLGIIPLNDVVQGRCNLLHKDQQSLFEVIAAHFQPFDPSGPRSGPTRAYKEKVKTLSELEELTAAWRAEGSTIGVTSGVFDIVHPGHISFLEDASQQCGRLIAIIASDRTVRAQKGSEKPYYRIETRTDHCGVKQRRCGLYFRRAISRRAVERAASGRHVQGRRLCWQDDHGRGYGGKGYSHTLL